MSQTCNKLPLLQRHIYLHDSSHRQVFFHYYIIIIIIIIVITYLLLTYVLTYLFTYLRTYLRITYLLTFTAIEFSLGDSSPYTSTDKTNKNEYT